MARDHLHLETFSDPEILHHFVGLARVGAGALCLQGRFTEALEFLNEHRQGIAAHPHAEASLAHMDLVRGTVLARSGRPERALQILEPLSHNPLAGVDGWFFSVLLAAAIGDSELVRDLCRKAIVRFSSNAEGQAAFWVAGGLLLQPEDETTLSVARELCNRLFHARDWSREFAHAAAAHLAFREKRPAEALSHLKTHFHAQERGTIRTGSDRISGWAAFHAFLAAALHAELGREEKAISHFNMGNQHLWTAIGRSAGGDRGASWTSTYMAELMRKDAEAAFAKKGLPMPPFQPDASSPPAR